MRNGVLSVESKSPAARSASRLVADRQAAYEREATTLIDAAFAVMERTGSIEPRVGDIVRRAKLSNQAFYRHFASKDDLLLAVLEEGQRRLIDHLERRIARATDAQGRLRAWIEGVLAQARDPGAAARTRPFAVNAARLNDAYPEETAARTEQLLAPLRAAVAELRGDPQRDADAVHELAMGTMRRAVTTGVAPTRADVEHLVRFAVAGIQSERRETSISPSSKRGPSGPAARPPRAGITRREP